MELPCIVLEMNDEEELITTLSDIKDHKNPNMIEMSLILKINKNYFLIIY